MRKLVIVVTMAAVGLGLAACTPVWDGGSAVTATPLGPLVTLAWPAATDPDAASSVASYRIDVDGTQVAVISSSLTSCVLTGLQPSNTYAIRITAYDVNGEWSGSYPTSPIAALSTTYTQPAFGNAGFVRSCVDPLDSDGDRLPDAIENGSGTYVSAADPGTSPVKVDTDADGLSDGDETLGTTAGLDLPSLGAHGVKKNILFEYDWFDDNAEPAGCAAHSHRPTAAIATRVSDAFAAAPVANPDRTTGIKAIQDYGQGGPFTGGNLVPDADGVIAGDVGGTDFTSIKAANFASNRQGYFHYTLLPHRYGTNSSSSGYAEFRGNDMVVSLYCQISTVNVANTIFHEVGHNLGLWHGGNEPLLNYKPNYNSVMNYRYQFSGIDNNCTLPGDGVLSYSVGTRAPLNEASLFETTGICNGVDIDWNGNGTIDTSGVTVDLTQDGQTTVLRDYNDWANISLSSVTAAGVSPLGAPESQWVTEQPVPRSAYVN